MTQSANAQVILNDTNMFLLKGRTPPPFVGHFCLCVSHLWGKLETQMGWRGATQLSVQCSSDATVISSVLEFAVEDEHGGEGGDTNVENQLPHIPHAKQVEVA